MERENNNANNDSIQADDDPYVPSSLMPEKADKVTVTEKINPYAPEENPFLAHLSSLAESIIPGTIWRKAVTNLAASSEVSKTEERMAKLGFSQDEIRKFIEGESTGELYQRYKKLKSEGKGYREINEVLKKKGRSLKATVAREAEDYMNRLHSENPKASISADILGLVVAAFGPGIASTMGKAAAVDKIRKGMNLSIETSSKLQKLKDAFRFKGVGKSLEDITSAAGFLSAPVTSTAAYAGSKFLKGREIKKSADATVAAEKLSRVASRTGGRWLDTATGIGKDVVSGASGGAENLLLQQAINENLGMAKDPYAPYMPDDDALAEETAKRALYGGVIGGVAGRFGEIAQRMERRRNIDKYIRHYKSGVRPSEAPSRLNEDLKIIGGEPSSTAMAKAEKNPVYIDASAKDFYQKAGERQSQLTEASIDARNKWVDELGKDGAMVSLDKFKDRLKTLKPGSDAAPIDKQDFNRTIDEIESVLGGGYKINRDTLDIVKVDGNVTHSLNKIKPRQASDLSIKLNSLINRRDRTPVAAVDEALVSLKNRLHGSIADAERSVKKTPADAKTAFELLLDIQSKSIESKKGLGLSKVKSESDMVSKLRKLVTPKGSPTRASVEKADQAADTLNELANVKIPQNIKDEFVEKQLAHLADSGVEKNMIGLVSDIFRGNVKYGTAKLFLTMLKGNREDVGAARKAIASMPEFRKQNFDQLTATQRNAINQTIQNFINKHPAFDVLGQEEQQEE